MSKRQHRTSSCDFDDIDEGEDGELATPVNQSTAKMDVESLLRRSKETRERVTHNLANHEDGILQMEVSGAKQNYKLTKNSTHSFNHPSESQGSDKDEHIVVEEKTIEIDEPATSKEDVRSDRIEKRVHTMENPFYKEANQMKENRQSDQLLSHANTFEMSDSRTAPIKNHKSERAYYKHPQKHVTITMSDKAGNFLKKYRNKGLADFLHLASPRISSGNRLVFKPSPQLTNRSSLSSKNYNFKISNVNKSSKYEFSSPTKTGGKFRSRIAESAHYERSNFDLLQQELDHERRKVGRLHFHSFLELLQLDKKFRIQKEKQLAAEIGNLHKIVRIREESITNERTKEKEIASRSMTENEK